MRVHVIGLGGAGGRIIDRLAADSDGDRFLQGLNAFDTDAAALDALRSIDESRRYRFGDAAGGAGSTATSTRPGGSATLTPASSAER